jgi:hypothetical protein
VPRRRKPPDHSTRCGSYTPYGTSRCVVCRKRCRLLNANLNIRAVMSFALSGLLPIGTIAMLLRLKIRSKFLSHFLLHYKRKVAYRYL